MVASSARADDFAPPPWVRGDPLTTSAEWEFLTSVAGHFPADGTEVPLVIGDFTGPPEASVFLGPDTPTWSPGDGDGEWHAALTGPMTMEFIVGNWVDLEPVKFLRIQVTFDGPAPFVSGLNAIDPSGPVTIVPAGTTLFDPSHILFEYELYPNPDVEIITLEMPAGGSIDQVVIDTISIPEPASMGLLALGGLALLRRRKK